MTVYTSLLRRIFLLACLSLAFATPAMAEQFNVLLFTKTAGWHHASIKEGVEAIEALSKRHFFNLTWEENADRMFNDTELAKFDVVIFLNTTGDILTDEQQAAFERFIQSGKGYVGIHAASDTEYEWPWYTKMVGRMFHIHPEIQTAALNVRDRNFPGMARLPDRLLVTEEWYEFGDALSPDLNVLLTVDESTYNPVADWGDRKGKGMGKFHPIAWYHNYDGGRAFYTNLGHMPATFMDNDFREHIYGGIYWAATGKGVLGKK